MEGVVVGCRSIAAVAAVQVGGPRAGAVVERVVARRTVGAREGKLGCIGVVQDCSWLRIERVVVDDLDIAAGSHSMIHHMPEAVTCTAVDQEL